MHGDSANPCACTAPQAQSVHLYALFIGTHSHCNPAPPPTPAAHQAQSVHLDAGSVQRRLEADAALARKGAAQIEATYKAERAHWVAEVDMQKFEARERLGVGGLLGCLNWDGWWGSRWGSIGEAVGGGGFVSGWGCTTCSGRNG